MKPVTRRAGVTSKAGLAPGLPGAAISTVASPPSGSRPVMFSSSSAARSSMGMSRRVASSSRWWSTGSAT